ncbi:dihydrodipicolinate synthase family protein [Blastococcus sp. MG754426]|uniref:dihydrodipicolinate synthase family protein n=1 Tax=unclassified Blastococcus TaxID=2619396 RepID=UPI001EEFC987|nr:MULTISPECIES: dihydrodipicolinate synthase family protein [unclassified Blastococcus]MCF6508121.1 dihydrodipicolinate synthase family protein [Blastococcus sp. MG754426]MCF6511550.1 dihydrodipicolinate synthase family protein [Blastococcus sp. MG754427]
MDRTDVTWRGYWAACPTPFREDGALDLDTFRDLLDFYAGEGLHGVLVNGTSGEWFAQTDAERRAVAEAAVEHVAGRMTVVIGCTDYTADRVAGLARHAMAAGADGVASTPPPYAKPFPDEIVEFYRDISRATDAPLMVYNWPHGTSVDIGTALAERIAEVDTVVALKDSTPDVAQFHATARALAGRVRVFGQFMSTEGFEVLLGGAGDGTIGGGTLFGAPDPQFWEAFWRGDHEVCRVHAKRIDELFPRLWLPGGWAGHWGAYQSQLKAIMAMLGQPGGVPRRPRLPVTDPASLQAIREVLVQGGLL